MYKWQAWTQNQDRSASIYEHLCSWTSVTQMMFFLPSHTKEDKNLAHRYYGYGMLFPGGFIHFLSWSRITNNSPKSNLGRSVRMGSSCIRTTFARERWIEITKIKEVGLLLWSRLDPSFAFWGKGSILDLLLFNQNNMSVTHSFANIKGFEIKCRWNVIKGRIKINIFWKVFTFWRF